jgi:hypothetical protein
MSRRDPTIRELLAGRDVACPKCRYNLRDIESGSCPECGFGFDAASLLQLKPRATLRAWLPQHLIVVLVCAWVAVFLLADSHPAGSMQRLIFGRRGFGLLGWCCILLLTLSRVSEEFEDHPWARRFLVAACCLALARLGFVFAGM